ncbi:MAG: NADH-quinone oxidoreductase subunit NuoF, partial [Dehalococcoidia bacterium]|nr:NADH-quinone oxidoreductase subunit NuoF [Dehalococcoidia bacterium]
RIVKEHLENGTFVEGLLYRDLVNGAPVPHYGDIPFYAKQTRLVLRNCGRIDPTSIDDYLASNGYNGFKRALELGPEGIVEEIKRSGLRGRGGAGFSTSRKWQFCRDAKADRKFLICNADEGDPGAFMNRSLLEGDPHSLLEGMLIAGYAIGAHEGYIYCRAEYPLALERLRIAMDQAEERGLLGDDILGSGFGFRIRVSQGAGAFVCGEETGLILSIEGERGMPRPRPPFPAVSGLMGKPTVVNNVETLASVALILQNGAGQFAQYGTENSKGTKTFALVGKIKLSGLVEVPLGITMREIVYDIGGGILDDKQLKAVQTGGPSGGCVPASMIDIPVDYDSLTAAGTIMGSGGMVVMDEDTCMVDVARYFLDFTQKESCGKCVPCRLGTKQMLAILEDITQGRGTPEDIDLLLEMGAGVKSGSLCGLGQTAPNPVLTTIRYFRDEYEAHVNEKRCPAKVCTELISYNITDSCVGCLLCFKACSSEAIVGEFKKLHVIDQSKCTKCGSCFDVCPPKVNAVEILSGQLVGAPLNDGGEN